MTTHEPEPAGVIPDAIEAAFREGWEKGAEDGIRLCSSTAGGHSRDPANLDAEWLRSDARAALPFMVGDAEPVAWRLFDGPACGWLLYHSLEDAPEGASLEPLYLHPALVSLHESAGETKSPPDAVMHHLQKALKAAVPAGLYLKITVEEARAAKPNQETP